MIKPRKWESWRPPDRSDSLVNQSRQVTEIHQLCVELFLWVKSYVYLLCVSLRRASLESMEVLLDFFHCSSTERFTVMNAPCNNTSIHAAVQGRVNPYGRGKMLGISWFFFFLTRHKNSLMSFDSFFQCCGSAFCLWLISDHRSFIRFELRPTATSSLPLPWWSYIQIPLKAEVCFDNLTCLPTSVSQAGPLWSAPN